MRCASSSRRRRISSDSDIVWPPFVGVGALLPGVCDPGRLTLGEPPDPEPGGGELLVDERQHALLENVAGRVGDTQE